MTLHSIQREIHVNNKTIVWMNHGSCQTDHSMSDYDRAPTDHHNCVRKYYKSFGLTDIEVYFCECSICLNFDVRHYFIYDSQTTIGTRCDYCMKGTCPAIPREFLND